MLDIVMSDELWTLLLISLTFSIFLMALVQKIKMLNFVTKKWHVWIINLFCSFLMGIPFGMFFYGLTVYQSIWISLFGFIGAPSIYETLKSQNMINYKPKSATVNKDYTCISKSNEIKRSDKL